MHASGKSGKIFPCKAEFFFSLDRSLFQVSDVHSTSVPTVRPPIVYRYPIVCYTGRSILHLRLHGGTSISLRSSGQFWMRVIPSACLMQAETLPHKAIFYPFWNPLFTTSTPPRPRRAHQTPLICECIRLFSIYRCVTVELAVL